MRSRGLAWVIVQVILLGTIVLVPRRIAGLPAMPPALVGISVVFGLLIGLLGLLIVGLSALYLGTNLTIFPAPRADGALTQSGLYALVRHPMYGGVLLSALGWSLFQASLPALLLTLLLGIFFDRKAAYEERRLIAQYPEYATYRRRVRKLIPLVY